MVSVDQVSADVGAHGVGICGVTISRVSVDQVSVDVGARSGTGFNVFISQCLSIRSVLTSAP